MPKYTGNKEQYVPQWEAMLQLAITEPGKMLEAYRAFHSYSLNNQMLATFQCSLRGVEVGPIKTAKSWEKVGRRIKKGESGIYMCFPKSGKKVDAKTGEETTWRSFHYAKYWFTYSQTEGEEFNEEPIKALWDWELAYKELKIDNIPFEMVNGNAQGYAQFPNKVAINPMAQLPYKTRFHELAHIVLGHVSDASISFVDGEHIERNVREVEAEGVAMLCLDALGLDGAEYCRGYMQNWSQGNPINADMSKRIIAAADKILRVGNPTKREYNSQD